MPAPRSAQVGNWEALLVLVGLRFYTAQRVAKGESAMNFTMSGRALTAAACLLIVGSALAQAPMRVRGTIEQLDGDTLSIKGRDGTSLKLVLADNTNIRAVMKRSLDDIKVGEFVGTAATSNGDGTWQALEVHIFPENMRGTGEGHRPWEGPNSSMTNATVTDKVRKMDGHTMTLRYKGGEQKIVVSDSTPVVSYAPGGRSDLTPGKVIFVPAATKSEDGSLRAPAISVERTAPPPM